jgi:hypothetical protein
MMHDKTANNNPKEKQTDQAKRKSTRGKGFIQTNQRGRKVHIVGLERQHQIQTRCKRSRDGPRFPSFMPTGKSDCQRCATDKQKPLKASFSK